MKKEIKLSKEIIKNISKLRYYSEDRFIQDAKNYIKAIKEYRMLCNIQSISKSGLSRLIYFFEFEVKKRKGYTYNYYGFLQALGYKMNNDGYFRVNGCGMDMIFETNYNIIQYLKEMNFITKKQCKILEQKTPKFI